MKIIRNGNINGMETIIMGVNVFLKLFMTSELLGYEDKKEAVLDTSAIMSLLMEDSTTENIENKISCAQTCIYY